MSTTARSRTSSSRRISSATRNGPVGTRGSSSCRRGTATQRRWPSSSWSNRNESLVPTYSFTLEYDGTDFAGWQIQPSVRTAMGAFSDALHALTSEAPALTAAGRTDSGAHAHGQVVGCTLERDWAPDELRNALNATLPADLAVRDVATRNDGFDARRDAVDRTYRYLIVCRDGRSPVLRRNAWTVRGPLDVDAMRR